MKRSTLVLTFLISFWNPAHAEPGPIGQWLMNEPVTLWDWGMMRMENDAVDAAGSDYKPELFHNLGFLAWTSATSYNWDNNEIEIWFSGFRSDGDGEITHESCNQVRRWFSARSGGILAISTFDFGSYTFANEAIAREGVYSEIDWWFSHAGFQKGSRDETLAEELARIVVVITSLRDRSQQANGIECRARITDFDAPSKPYP